MQVEISFAKQRTISKTENVYTFSSKWSLPFQYEKHHALKFPQKTTERSFLLSPWQKVQVAQMCLSCPASCIELQQIGLVSKRHGEIRTGSLLATQNAGRTSPIRGQFVLVISQMGSTRSWRPHHHLISQK